MFSEEFLQDLEDDPVQATRTFCNEFSRFDEDLKTRFATSIQDIHFDAFLEAFGFAQVLAEALGLTLGVPALVPSRVDSVKLIRMYVSALRMDCDQQHAHLTVEAARRKLAGKFKGRFYYEFSKGDIERAQTLINDIRECLTKSSFFEDAHKQRLLSRLEKLQQELHKKVSDLDAFWGLLGDAGVALGKFGNDAKPLFDRITQLTTLVWMTQARMEGLPSDCPLQLPSPICAPDQPPNPTVDV